MESQIKVEHRLKIDNYRILCYAGLSLFVLYRARCKNFRRFLPIWEALFRGVIDEACIAGDIQPSLMT